MSQLLAFGPDYVDFVNDLEGYDGECCAHLEIGVLADALDESGGEESPRDNVPKLFDFGENDTLGELGELRYLGSGTRL